MYSNPLNTIKLASPLSGYPDLNCFYGYPSGFNGKENDNEIKGMGNSLDFGARMYDSRLGRFYSTDPLIEKYPSLSTYHFVNNNPVYNIEADGKYFTGNTANVKAVYSIVSQLASLGNARAITFKAALEKMDASEVEFNIINSTKPGWFVGTGKGGATKFDVDNNRILIDVFTFKDGIDHYISKEGRTGHELEHGVQFLNGEISFKGSEPDISLTYDESDEVKSFQIQNLITNTQLSHDDRLKSDDDARDNAKQYSMPLKTETTLTTEQGEKFKNSSQTIRNSIYNYKPTEKQKLEKKSIFKND